MPWACVCSVLCSRSGCGTFLALPPAYRFACTDTISLDCMARLLFLCSLPLAVRAR